jgi:hypothetical protein
MNKSLGSFYGAIVRGLVVLAAAGAISQGRVFEPQEAARKSVKGKLVKLVKLSALNQRIVDHPRNSHEQGL